MSSGDSLTELTATLEVEELGTGRAGPTLELPDDIAVVSREFAARGWSDGLPVIPPDGGAGRRHARRYGPRPP